MSDVILQGPVPLGRRPFLIWVTQVLLVLIVVALSAMAIAFWPSTFRSALAAGAAPSRLALAVAFQLAIVALLITLFVGLARRRRWAWYGSIAFAIALLAMVVDSRIHPVNGPLPILPIPPEQQRGAAFAEIAITLLVVLYPLRLYFSRSVRAFFGLAR